MNEKWLYKISIKHLFEDETTPELIDKICSLLVKQLTVVKEKLENSKIKEHIKDVLTEELEVSIDNFDFLRRLAAKEIEVKDWQHYNFSGDFEEEFNGYLSQLYDLGDERVYLENGERHKFMWIG